MAEQSRGFVDTPFAACPTRPSSLAPVEPRRDSSASGFAPEIPANCALASVVAFVNGKIGSSATGTSVHANSGVYAGGASCP